MPNTCKIGIREAKDAVRRHHVASNAKNKMRQASPRKNSCNRKRRLFGKRRLVRSPAIASGVYFAHLEDLLLCFQGLKACKSHLQNLNAIEQGCGLCECSDAA